MLNIKDKLLEQEPGQSGTSPADEVAGLLVDYVGDDEPLKDDEVGIQESSDEVKIEGDDSVKEDDQSEDAVTWGKALGLDDGLVVLDDSGNLKGIKAKIDGKEEVVNVNELLTGYRNNRYNTQKSQALSEEYKQFQESKETVAKMYQEKVSDIEQLLEYTKAQMLRDYQVVNWDNLRATNPAEYAAMVQDFNLKNTEFDNLLSALAQEKEKISGQQQEEFKRSLESRNKEQMEITLRNNPEWNNPEKMKQAVSDLANFVVDSYGFTQQDFMSINDARIIEVLKDAMKFRTGVKEADKKIVQQSPKFQKQSSARKNNVTHLDRLIKRAESSTGTARRGAQTDAIAQLLLDEKVKL